MQRLRPRILESLLPLVVAVAAIAPRPASGHGPLEREIAEATAAIARSPGDARLLERRARLYLALGQWDAAMGDARAARVADPSACDACYSLARARFGMGDYEGAVLETTALLRCRPGDGDGTLLRARALAALGRDAEAAAEYATVIDASRDPSPDVYIERSRAQVRLGRTAQARRGLTEGMVRLGAPVSIVAELARLDADRPTGTPPGTDPDGFRAAVAPGGPHALHALRPDPRGGTATVQTAVTRGPYLQVATDTSIVVRWRTDVATDSRVRFGDTPGSATFTVVDPAVTTEHEVHIGGLAAESRYYYAVGSTAGDLAGGDAFHYFRTHPAPGTRRSVRIWAIGDSGQPGPAARNVRDAYLARPGSDLTDVWLMLGDNAYATGLDTEYQAAVFDAYPQLLRNTVLWPTRGNHDVLHTGPDNDYYEIFTMPTIGEAGGLPSGTEAYYSFDFANVHFICLDSHGSDRTPGGAMATWLSQDIAATAQEWVIAYWHHPPYTKGSHDSDNIADSGGRMTDMRQVALPILEHGGVDLILGGHSHSYERSFLLNGHYGLSTTLSTAQKIDDGDGNELGDGAYHKPTLGTGTNEGTVYAVAGSSSKHDGGPLNHPVMVTSLDVLGSMVIDVDGDRLDAIFLDDNGSVLDAFTIRKGVATGIARRRVPLLLAVESENPFRSSMRFRMEMPDEGPLTLSIYDVRGRRVRTLASGHRGAGIHYATWDGRNDQNNPVAPGVYFGVLEHRGELRIRKIVRIP